MKGVIIPLLFVLVSSPLRAESPETEVTVAGQLQTVSGDEGRMNDQEGSEPGVLVLARHADPKFTLDLRFEPTTEGWLTLSWKPDPFWRVEFSLDRTRRYSDSSVRPEATPLGTPVSQFYPGTNTLEPVWRDLEPVTTRMRWRARAAYMFASGVVDVTLRGVDLDGDKAAEPQGITFGDFGAPAFFTPGIRAVNTNQLEGAIGARFAFPWVSVAGRVAIGNLDSETALTLPAYGMASLLDLSKYTTSLNADTFNATLSAATQTEGFQLALGGSHSKVESTNGYAAGIVNQSASCQVCGGGITINDLLTNGTSEVRRTDAAGSFTVEPILGLEVRVSGRLGHEETEASGVESLVTRDYALSQTQDIDRFKTAGEVTWRYQGLRVSALGGREQTTNDASFIRGPAVDQSKAERVVDRIRGEARFKSGSFRVAVSGGHERHEVTMTYKELISGYQLGSRDGTRDDIKATLSGKLGRLPFILTGSYLTGTADLEPPLFEPVYDPTWELSVSQAKTKVASAVFHIATPGGSALEAWGEAGFRQEEWEFEDTVVFPGFLNVDEKVKGFTAAIGFNWVPSESWRIDFSGWLDAPSETVDHRAYRLEAGIEKRLTKTLDALVRYHYRRFDEALYSLDDYTLSAFTLGVRGRF